MSTGATTVTTTPSLAASATVWMRTWNAGTTTWTWQASKTTRPASEPVSGQGPVEGEGREKCRRWPFEAASRGPHYCGTCLEPLDGTSSPLRSSTNMWAQASTIHQVFKARAHQQSGLLLSEVLGVMSNSLDLMVSDDVIILMLALSGKC